MSGKTWDHLDADDQRLVVLALIDSVPARRHVRSYLLSGGGCEQNAEMICGVIGRVEKTVIDCPDPRALAEFYCQVLGMKVNEDTDGWVVIGCAPGFRQLAFQRCRLACSAVV